MNRCTYRYHDFNLNIAPAVPPVMPTYTPTTSPATYTVDTVVPTQNALITAVIAYVQCISFS